jgi:hypothetical protein
MLAEYTHAPIRNEKIKKTAELANLKDIWISLASAGGACFIVGLI